MSIPLTDENFEDEVIKSKQPVLIDFWAEWCGPCKMIAPIIEELSKEYSGKIKVGKINVDENPAVSSRLGIRSIPTLIIFKDGEIMGQLVGVQSKEIIKEKVNSLIS
ncbi:MAG: thioredoxin [Candidatus Firestonebacteria bacterium]